jgi:glucose uptake protein GlcU
MSFISIVTEHVNFHTYDQLLYVAVGIVCSHLFLTLAKKNSV